MMRKYSNNNNKLRALFLAYNSEKSGGCFGDNSELELHAQFIHTLWRTLYRKLFNKILVVVIHSGIQCAQLTDFPASV